MNFVQGMIPFWVQEMFGIVVCFYVKEGNWYVYFGYLQSISQEQWYNLNYF